MKDACAEKKSARFTQAADREYYLQIMDVLNFHLRWNNYYNKNDKPQETMKGTGATYPKVYKGNPIQPMEGRSLRSAFANQALEREVPLFWEHGGNAAIRVRNMKLVCCVENIIMNKDSYRWRA